MQLTRKTEYAVRTLIELAARPEGEFVPTEEIARAKNIPEMYLSKTVQDLVRAGFVQTQRGCGGGVRLARPAESFTLVDVLVAIQGPLAINSCLLENSDCPNKPVCRVHQLLVRAQESLLDVLGSASFAELAGKIKKEGRGEG